jgi:hypothetical protein
MTMQEAMDIINNKPKGYMVVFEWIDGSILKSDYFPDGDGGEKLIEAEWEAWELANRFAKVTKGRTCNIYVVDDKFSPVEGYEDRQIANR